MSDETEDGALEPGTLLIEDPTLSGGFTQIPNVIFDAENLSCNAKFLYMALLKYAWEKDRCFPGYASLRKVMSASENKVRRAMLELQEKGLVAQKRRGQGRSNIYTLLTFRTSKTDGQESQNENIQNERASATSVEDPNPPQRTRKKTQEEYSRIRRSKPPIVPRGGTAQPPRRFRGKGNEERRGEDYYLGGKYGANIEV